MREDPDLADPSGAARELLDRYGAEVFGFVGALLDDRAARVVYAAVADRAQRDIGAFRGRCALRTWLYALARDEVARHRTCAAPGPASEWADDDCPPVTTVPARRVGRAATVAEFRSGLAPQDRELLILRFDRSLPWTDIAITSLGDDAPPEALADEARRAQSRVEEIRADLARLAIEKRILSPKRESTPRRPR